MNVYGTYGVLSMIARHLMNSLGIWTVMIGIFEPTSHQSGAKHRRLGKTLSIEVEVWGGDKAGAELILRGELTLKN